MKLRDYQHRCVEANLAAFDDNATVLNVMPTGTGKTITFAETIARYSRANGSRAMVVAHREELIRQACDKIKRVTGMEPEVEMAEYRADQPHIYHRAPVIVSTVQTQNSGKKPRMERFDPFEFNLLVVDEAHHATSPSYQKIIAHYRRNYVFSDAPLHLIGTTKKRSARCSTYVVSTTDCSTLSVTDGWWILTNSMCR